MSFCPDLFHLGDARAGLYRVKCIYFDPVKSASKLLGFFQKAMLPVQSSYWLLIIIPALTMYIINLHLYSQMLSHEFFLFIFTIIQQGSKKFELCQSPDLKLCLLFSSLCLFLLPETGKVFRYSHLLKRVPDHRICPLRNLYVSKEATIRTRHGQTDWFKIGKAVWQRLYIVTPLI